MSGECDVCGEHTVDCKCEIKDILISTLNVPPHPKMVYVLFYFSKTYNELIGVYSTEESATRAYNNVMMHMGSKANFTGLSICVIKLDENHEW